MGVCLLAAKDLQNQMIKLLDDHPEASFFCDETPIGGSYGLATDFLVKFSQRFKVDSAFWLACNHKKPSPIKLESGDAMLTR